MYNELYNIFLCVHFVSFGIRFDRWAFNHSVQKNSMDMEAAALGSSLYEYPVELFGWTRG